MPDDLARLTEALLHAARHAGAEAADSVALAESSSAIDVRAGALEQAERSEGIDLGLRVLIGHRQACVSTSDARAETIERMAERAVAMARAAPEDPSVGLAAPEALARDLDATALELADPAAEPAPATLEDEARRAEAAALAVAGVAQVQASAAGYGRRRIHLAATNGFSGGYERTEHSLSCVAISGEGTAMERDYHGESRVFQGDLPDAEEIGRIAGERAASRSGPRRPRTGAYPVVYDERIASALIGHLLQATNGSAIVRGASWLRDAMGEAVLPEALSLLEDPRRPRVAGSRPFDAEGLATRPRALVEAGRLAEWTLDLATGRKLGLASTASAVRGPSSPPAPSVSNVTLTPGQVDRAGLLAEMGTGLLVTSMLGASINPTTGDYSRGASGYWVENGEIAYPVNECTIAGNLREMFRTLRPANDARPHMSRRVPSLLVEGLTLAGD